MNTTTAVLVRGTLTQRSLAKIKLEIEHCSNQLILVIDSEGGDTRPTVNFMNWLDQRQRGGLALSARIYRAYSAAAGIALVPKDLEIDRDGEFEIHLGSVIIETNEILGMMSIPRRFLQPALAWRRNMQERLGAVTPGLPSDLQSRLHAQNRLRLTPIQCLQYGFVAKVF